MSFFISIVFLGGWLPIIFLDNLIPVSFHFALKVFFIVFSFIWVRATLPRYRFDQLMILGWKCLLPMSIGWLILTSSVLIFFDLLSN